MLAIFLSASLLFFVGRYTFKDKVDQFISKSEGSRVWKGLMKYMGNDWKEAAKINILLCFMPVPVSSSCGMLRTAESCLLNFRLKPSCEPEKVGLWM